jgi:glycerol kinase
LVKNRLIDIIISIGIWRKCGLGVRKWGGREVSGENFILALELGIKGVTAVLFDRFCSQRAICWREVKRRSSEAGWIELNPEELWDSALEAVKGVIRESGISAGNLSTIGVAGQRGSAVVWDRQTSRAIHNALATDGNPAGGAARPAWSEGFDETVSRKTGLDIENQYGAPKLRWLLQNVEGAAERAARGDLLFGPLESWLIWKLSSGQVQITDFSGAAATLLFDIQRLEWDGELMGIFSVPATMLPDARPSSGILALTDPYILGSPVPITGLAADRQAALFGLSCFTEGGVRVSYGGGCSAIMPTGRKAPRSKHGLATTIAWGIDGGVEYALEGRVTTAGAAVEWLRDSLGIFPSGENLSTLAVKAGSSEGLYFVPAFDGLGAPYSDPKVRGALMGLTGETSRGQIVRAALESIAFQVRDLLDCMEKDSGISLLRLRVDDAYSHNDFLMQFQADVLGTPVERFGLPAAAALGVAYLAGLAVGYWKDRGEIAALRTAADRFEPKAERAEMDRLHAGWVKAVVAAMNFK